MSLSTASHLQPIVMLGTVQFGAGCGWYRGGLLLMGRVQEFLDTELLLTELFALQLVEVCGGCSSRSHVSCWGAVDGTGHTGELLTDCSSAALDVTQPTGADAGWG